MTKEGRLARGKKNYYSKIFLDNPETLEYIKSLEVVEVEKPKEVKNAGRNRGNS